MNNEPSEKQEEVPWAGFQTLKVVGQIVALGVALGTLVAIYCQIDEMTKQTGEMIRQTDQMTEQTKAIWYSNRPVLRIPSINPSRDIQPFMGQIKTSLGTFFDSTHFSRFNFTIENVGNSPALIEEIYHEVATRDTIRRHTSTHGDLASLPKDRAVAPMYLLLTRGQRNIFEIRIVYNWEKPVDLDEKFTLKKYFLADYANRSWQVKVLPSELYRAEKEELCRGKDL